MSSSCCAAFPQSCFSAWPCFASLLVLFLSAEVVWRCFPSWELVVQSPNPAHALGLPPYQPSEELSSALLGLCFWACRIMA